MQNFIYTETDSLAQSLKEMITTKIHDKIKASVSIDIIGDTVVVSITAIQDIVYTYSYRLGGEDKDIPNEYLAAYISKKALKRYKRYIKNLFFKNAERLDYLDTKLYNR